jgi:hypothetical protein
VKRKWKNALIAEFQENRFILKEVAALKNRPEQRTIQIDKTMDVQAFLPLKTAVIERTSIDILIEHIPPRHLVFIQAIYDSIRRFNSHLRKPIGQNEYQSIRVDYTEELIKDINEAIKELKRF